MIYRDITAGIDELESTLDTAVLSGRVTRAMAPSRPLPPDYYLTVDPEVRLVYAAGDHHQRRREFYGGILQLTGVTFDGSGELAGGTLESLDGVRFGDYLIRFGDSEDGTSGDGFIRNCEFRRGRVRLFNQSQEIESSNSTLAAGDVHDAAVTLWGTSSAEIDNITGVDSIDLWGTATADITGNTGGRRITLHDATDVDIRYNTLSEGVVVMGAGEVYRGRQHHRRSGGPRDSAAPTASGPIRAPP